MINTILGQFKDQKKKKVGEVQILALHKFFNIEKEKKRRICAYCTLHKETGVGLARRVLRWCSEPLWSSEGSPGIPREKKEMSLLEKSCGMVPCRWAFYGPDCHLLIKKRK